MRHDFRKLIEGFCTFSGLDQPERIIAGGAIMIKDVMFSILHNERVNPELFFIYCHVGELPRGNELEACKILMESNLALYTGTGPTFALDSKSGTVLFIDNARLDRCDPEKLNGILLRLADKAQEWQSGHFLKARQPQQTYRPQSTAGRLVGLGSLAGMKNQSPPIIDRRKSCPSDVI